jgi:hypothetical protein
MKYRQQQKPLGFLFGVHMKSLTIIFVLVSFSLPALSGSDEAIEMYRSLYQDYSEQFDLRQKYQNLYNKEKAKYESTSDFYQEQLGQKSDLCSNVVEYSKELYYAATNRINILDNEIDELRLKAKGEKLIDVTFALMVLNARIEIDKTKLRVAKNQIDIYSTSCNYDGINDGFVNELKKKITEFAGYADDLDVMLEKTLIEVTNSANGNTNK